MHFASKEARHAPASVRVLVIGGRFQISLPTYSSLFTMPVPRADGSWCPIQLPP